MSKLFAMRKMFELIAILNTIAGATASPEATKTLVFDTARELMELRGYAPDTALALAIRSL